MRKFAHTPDIVSTALYFETIKMHTANFFLPVCLNTWKTGRFFSTLDFGSFCVLYECLIYRIIK